MSKPPVLLLHGALGSSAQLLPLQLLLEKSGRKVFNLNFSGHGGKSFSSEFGIEQFASEIIDFLSEQQITLTDIFGYSMGGYAALYAAHKYPSRFEKIATLGTKFDWNPQSSEHEIKKLNPEKILEKVPAFASALEKRHAPNSWRELLQKTSSMMVALGHRPLLTEETLKSIQHDITICLGDADDMTSTDYSRFVAETLPHGKFKSLEHTPHPIEKVNLEILCGVIEAQVS